MTEQVSAEINQLPPVSVETLLGAVPERKNIAPDNEPRAPEMYTNFGSALLTPYVRQTLTYTDYIVCGPPIDGWEINALLYFVAPHKNQGYGFDTEDIVLDWDRLFRDPANLDRLKRHQKIEGWRQYSRNREVLQEPLKKALFLLNRGDDPQDRSDRYVPVMRWRYNNWVFDLKKNAVANYLAQNFQGGIFEPRKFNSLLGLMFLATFTPEITESWPEYMNYAGKGSATLGEGFREIGPTQILPVVVGKVSELLHTRLKRQIEAYCVDPESFSERLRQPKSPVFLG